METIHKSITNEITTFNGQEWITAFKNSRGAFRKFLLAAYLRRLEELLQKGVNTLQKVADLLSIPGYSNKHDIADVSLSATMGNNLTVWRDVLPKVAGVNQEGTQEAKGPWEVIGFIRLLPADKVNYEKIVICFVRRACTGTAVDNINILIF